MTNLILKVGSESMLFKEDSLGFEDLKFLHDLGIINVSFADLKRMDYVARSLAGYGGCGGCVDCAGDAKVLIGFLDGVVYPALTAGRLVSIIPSY